MTRKEAAEKIKAILKECTEDEDAVCYVTSDDADALDTAIKALKQEPCEDCISRQAAIDAARDWYEGLICGSFKGLEKRLRALPSAQPEKEKAKRVLWAGWKGHRNTRYKCPNCKKPVKNDDIYCHRCGQKLMFPHISFTDYVPGERQETIVRWDDE